MLMLIVLLLAFPANFAKKQTYQVSPVTYWFALASVLICFWLKRKNYFTADRFIYTLFNIEDFYRTGFMWWTIFTLIT